MTDLRDEGPENPPPAWEAPNWEEFLGALEYMRACGSFDWADDTLEGIEKSVAERERVTEGQLQAVKNIAEGMVRRSGKREGWNRPSDIDGALSVLD